MTIVDDDWPMASAASRCLQLQLLIFKFLLCFKVKEIICFIWFGFVGSWFCRTKTKTGTNP